jgi:hypothetical protein
MADNDEIYRDDDPYNSQLNQIVGRAKNKNKRLTKIAFAMLSGLDFKDRSNCS